MPRKPPAPDYVNARIPREIWERVVAAAEASDPRVSAAALLESLLRRALAAHVNSGR